VTDDRKRGLAQQQIASAGRSPDRPLEVLLLCDCYPAGTTLEHICAFSSFSRNRIHTLSNLGELPHWLDLLRFDALILHYSLVAARDNYLPPAARQRIREFRGFKAVFVQDDYRWINDTVDALAYMRINALFPLTGPDIVDKVYSPERLRGVRKETVLTGYVPEELARRPVLPLADRPLDVGYRARKLPAWIGSHGQQKWQIAERFGADAPRYGLKVDLSYREEDRIYGDAWIEFVSGCKAMLGTESGASVCDFTGSIQRNVEAHVKRKPNTSFETLRDLYFKEEDGRVLMNVISPRCFEAAALRTLMILYDGHYSGVLKAWRHYVPLLRDHSNMGEVVRILRDPNASQEIVDRAHEEIALNPDYTFRAMVQRVDRIIEEGFQPAMSAMIASYSLDEFAWYCRSRIADITDLADIKCALEFEPDAPLDNILREFPGKQAATTLSGLPLPHVLEMKFKRRVQTQSIRLVWADEEAIPAEGTLTLFAGESTAATIGVASESPTVFSNFRFSPSANIDRLQLRIDRYHIGDRLRLRDIRVEADENLAKRLERERQRHFWIRKRIEYGLSLIWARLPDEAKAVLRPPARLLKWLLSPAPK